MSRNNSGENKVIGKKLIYVPHDQRGVFLERVNRFLGRVEINGREEYAHIHDPGRLEEILYPGNRVLLRKAKARNRKTKWDIIAGYVDDKLVFIHSGYHRKIAEKIILDEEISPLGKVLELKAEVRYGKSRLDFMVLCENSEIWVEVKGCTLAKNGIALFPDAPTVRGRRHLEELISISKNKSSAVIFLIFREDARCFAPNEETDPEFAETFKKAMKFVSVYPILLRYDGEWIYYVKEIPICNIISHT